jgi:hypothetical protein
MDILDVAESPKSISYWCESSDATEKAGDYLGACEKALLGLEQHPLARELQYRAVLNLSRSGAQKRARQLWIKTGLSPNLQGQALKGSLEENIAALGARLDREEAFLASATEQTWKLRHAAASYESIYRRTRGTFPGINAAVLYELSGNESHAKDIATLIVKQCDRDAPRSTEDAYQLAADRAAANLILNELDAAQKAIDDASKLASNASSVATTRKQLLQVCDRKNINHTILAPLKNRSVIHYCQQPASRVGRLGELPANQEACLVQVVKKELEKRDAGYAYGSLGPGADIVLAEDLLERHAELCIVLPFETQSFRRGAILPAGSAWLARFDNCLERVTDVVNATDGDFALDREVFVYASRLAAGMALVRARNLLADFAQLAVSDCLEAGGGQPRIHVREERSHSYGTFDELTFVESTRAEECSPATRPPRKVRAILFGDFEHFSGLNDGQMLGFFEHVMGSVAATLDQFEPHIVLRNTWGDGLYIVLDDVATAAKCALKIQSDLGRLNLVSLGLPATLALRVGLHAGAVFEINDPVLKSIGFTGTHISRTARIEPITPAGEVYVTEAFAALLALEGQPSFVCEYVGLMKLPKDYGRLRTYVLRSEPATRVSYQGPIESLR